MYLSLLDPLKLLALKEGAWFATLWSLYTIGGISIERYIFILLSLSIWWLCWKYWSTRFGSRYQQASTILATRFASIKLRDFMLIALICILITGLFAIVSIYSGAGGDARINVLKKLRLFEGFIALLTPFVMFRLIVDGKKIFYFILIFLIFLNIIFGGKSAILAILFPIALAARGGYIKESYGLAIIVILTIVIGMTVSILLNYGADSIFATIALRVISEGDVYTLSFLKEGLEGVEINSMLQYVFSPILKAAFLPISFDENIGAQIAANISGADGVSGPNGHWSILLLVSGYSGYIENLFLSLLFFLPIIYITFYFIRPRFVRNTPIALLIPWSLFAISFPPSFFGDPSYMFIYLVHALLVSFVLFFILSIFRYFSSTHIR